MSSHGETNERSNLAPVTLRVRYQHLSQDADANNSELSER